MGRQSKQIGTPVTWEQVSIFMKLLGIIIYTAIFWYVAYSIADDTFLGGVLSFLSYIIMFIWVSSIGDFWE
jgi:ABC-type multidrug transport system fused ATPase/permease subunit